MTNADLEAWVAKALANNIPIEEFGRFSNDLLSVAWRADDIEPLRAVFTSDIPEVRGLAAFLAVELYDKARPFIREIAAMVIDERSPRGRHDLYEALSHIVTFEDGWAVRNLLGGLDDEHTEVRLKVMRIATCLDDRVMHAGIKDLTSGWPDERRKAWSAAWYGSRAGKPDPLELLLASEYRLDRNFAAALCMRPRHVLDAQLAGLVSRQSDEDIQTFGSRQRRNPSPFWAVGPLDIPSAESPTRRRQTTDNAD
jgi:hypothetical protein